MNVAPASSTGLASVARFSQAMLPKPVVEVGLVGVARLVDSLNADHGIQIAGADRDRTRGVVVDGEARRGHGLGDRVGPQQHVVDLQHAVGQAVGIVRAAIDHGQRARAGQRVGADLKRRAGQQHRIGIGGPLLPGDRAQAVVEVGLIGVAWLVAPLNADHGIQVASADRDRTRGVVVDGEAGGSHGLGDRVRAQQHVVDLQHAVGQAVGVVRAAIDHESAYPHRSAGWG